MQAANRTRAIRRAIHRGVRYAIPHLLFDRLALGASRRRPRFPLFKALQFERANQRLGLGFEPTHKAA
jgi:hypothetical protein